MVALDRMTAPIYNPIRRVMPDLGALDLTPMVVLLGILIIRQAILPPLFSSLM
jgi:YggT family protein